MDRLVSYLKNMFSLQKDTATKSTSEQRVPIELIQDLELAIANFLIEKKITPGHFIIRCKEQSGEVLEITLELKGQLLKHFDSKNLDEIISQLKQILSIDRDYKIKYKIF